MSSNEPVLPSFIIIGAMKCATTTLYEQLASQPGIFLPELKEPNFFSNDEQYRKGMDWYEDLFSAAEKGALLGEASTHYTKLPTYPKTLERIKAHLPPPKFIYMMRHPVDRLVSQYIHEWSQGVITTDINRAIDKHPELIAYSRYNYQLEPFVAEYGRSEVLPIFFEELKQNPQAVLERVCEFIGYAQSPTWSENLAPSNVSKERIKKFPLSSLLIDSAPAEFIRRNFVPRKLRDRVKQKFQMRERPQLTEESLAKVVRIFDEDLALLGDQLGVSLNCENFKSVAGAGGLAWKKNPPEGLM